MKQEIKKYFKHFMIPFIIIGVLLIIWIAVEVTNANAPEEASLYYDSTNFERIYPSQRVFDYADLLTDQEEAELEEYIYYKEKETCTDIVIVVLNEPLENYEVEYRSRYSIPVTPDKWVMVYADKFWEDNKFGYDRPQILDGTPNSGDGVILVDNNYREGPDNKIYTWLGTTGKAERELSSSEIDTILDAFYDRVDYDYYGACLDFIDEYCMIMNPQRYSGSYTGDIDPRIIFIFAPIVMIIYIAIHWKTKSGKVTVTPKTYLVSGNALFSVRNDIFLRKSVSKTRISSESSGGGGGGGGHHVSGGGGSHGGGGHSR